MSELAPHRDNRGGGKEREKVAEEVGEKEARRSEGFFFFVNVKSRELMASSILYPCKTPGGGEERRREGGD